MKRLFAIVSALLIITGLKAQKANVQKETVKPKADTLVKSSASKQLNKPAVQQKDVKIAPAIKFAPATKVAPASTKIEKQTPVQQ